MGWILRWNKGMMGSGIVFGFCLLEIDIDWRMWGDGLVVGKGWVERVMGGK
jgi:hypothetical protein